MDEAENNTGNVKILWRQGLAVFCEHVTKTTKYLYNQPDIIISFVFVLSWTYLIISSVCCWRRVVPLCRFVCDCYVSVYVLRYFLYFYESIYFPVFIYLFIYLRVKSYPYAIFTITTDLSEGKRNSLTFGARIYTFALVSITGNNAFLCGTVDQLRDQFVELNYINALNTPEV
jgi:hypothetical protein